VSHSEITAGDLAVIQHRGNWGYPYRQARHTRTTVGRPRQPSRPRQGATVATIKIPEGGESFLTIGYGSIWVLNKNTGTVARIDPTSNAVTAQIRVAAGSIGGGDIAAGGGYVWARVTDALVAKIDPASNTVVARYGPASGSGSVADDGQAVWISAHNATTTWRLPLS
jgi:streptogramin lyase